MIERCEKHGEDDGCLKCISEFSVADFMDSNLEFASSEEFMTLIEAAQRRMRTLQWQSDLRKVKELFASGNTESSNYLRIKLTLAKPMLALQGWVREQRNAQSREKWVAENPDAHAKEQAELKRMQEEWEVANGLRPVPPSLTVRVEGPVDAGVVVLVSEGEGSPAIPLEEHGSSSEVVDLESLTSYSGLP